MSNINLKRIPCFLLAVLIVSCSVLSLSSHFHMCRVKDKKVEIVICWWSIMICSNSCSQNSLFSWIRALFLTFRCVPLLAVEESNCLSVTHTHCADTDEDSNVLTFFIALQVMQLLERRISRRVHLLALLRPGTICYLTRSSSLVTRWSVLGHSYLSFLSYGCHGLLGICLFQRFVRLGFWSSQNQLLMVALDLYCSSRFLLDSLRLSYQELSIRLARQCVALLLTLSTGSFSAVCRPLVPRIHSQIHILEELLPPMVHRQW